MKKILIDRLNLLVCLLVFLGSRPGTGTTLASHESDDDEPPRNPFLADSAWPMTHRNTYNQGSALLPGPERNDRLRVDFTYLSLAVIGFLSTKPDASGNSNLWFHTITKTGKLLATNRGAKVVNTGVC
jgi:hypothetical protein